MVCGMIREVCRDTGKEYPCTNEAHWVYKKDPRFCICRECYESLADEPDIQAEYHEPTAVAAKGPTR